MAAPQQAGELRGGGARTARLPELP